MGEDKQREIASMGGRTAHEKGTAHEFTSEEAREAGRKGGEAVSQDREHMAEIGAKGGQASHGGGQNQRRDEGTRSERDDDDDNNRRSRSQSQNQGQGGQGGQGSQGGRGGDRR
ncbi:KGG domain-containing protein [Nannocystis pusilla]